MKHDLNTAPLFLLVEAEAGETPDQIFSSLAQMFDPRHDDTTFGPLYKIGPKYNLGARTFFQIQTFAGSLGARLMLAISNRHFHRSILIRFSTQEGPCFDLIEPNKPNQRVKEQQLSKCEPSAAPNSGPATAIGNSLVTERPPSHE